jgi:hypothetical protein
MRKLRLREGNQLATTVKVSKWRKGIQKVLCLLHLAVQLLETPRTGDSKC